MDTSSQAVYRVWRRFKGAVLSRLHLLWKWSWIADTDISVESNPPSQRERWTLLEGFYAYMGGFVMVWEDGRREIFRPLARVAKLEIKRGIAPVPLEEIQDKSKDDWVSNVIALVQTAWFVLQCCARVAQHLPLSILELGTLGYVAATTAIHVFWMHKPKDVRTPTRVHIRNQTISESSKNDTSEHISSAELNEDETKCAALLVGPDCRPPSPSHDVVRLHSPAHTPSDGDIENRSVEKHDVDLDVDLYNVGVMTTCVMCTLFGSWHCIAWNSYFPTDVEHLLWRIASILSALPAIPYIVGEIVSKRSSTFHRIGNMIKWTGYLLYIFARGFLLVEMFLSLRRMPDGVFQTVQWTNFIPHI
ncbi:hypothetical protein CERSUDRAFT_60635 [Gelatoporia subvermispora B]|uniref:Uncharacterized protein n=1 Tax=Ceriporiopsis subvermispora (strain B) TaxID=914234 RepID=M2Q2I9_CERS8|nr:hypothetical protein CERSUDRAFT_60635 [Gelatoporia subvermispora B]